MINIKFMLVLLILLLASSPVSASLDRVYLDLSLDMERSFSDMTYYRENMIESRGPVNYKFAVLFLIVGIFLVSAR